MGTDIADTWVTPSDAWTDTHDALICQRNAWRTDILKQRRAPSTLKEVCRDRDKQTLPGTTKYSHREGENWRGKRDEGEDKHRQSHFVEKCWTYLAYFGTMTLSDSICWDPRLQAVLFAAALLEFYGSVLRHFWDVKAPTWADAGSISAKRKASRVSETKRSWEDLGRSGKLSIEKCKLVPNGIP